MIDHVLVTIETEKTRRDMELPDKLPVDELSKKLLEVLRENLPSEFRNKDGISLFYEGRQLIGGKSLSEQYVWDGSILKIR